MTSQFKNNMMVKQDIPFQLELSLKLVIEKWRKSMSPAENKLIEIERILKEYPYLEEPIDDIAILHQHQDFLELLFEPLLSLKSWSNSINSICVPFDHNKCLLATKAYEKTFHRDTVIVNGMESLMKGIRMDVRLLYAYKAILKKFYNLDLKIDLPITISSYNQKSGLYRYFKLMGNTQFVEVINLVPLPDLDEQKLKKMLDQDFDIESWLNILPPQNFLIRGVTMTTLMDITIEESTKRIQFSLLNRKESKEAKWFDSIQQELRNLFRLPNLRLGLATLQKNRKLNFASSHKIWNSLLIKDLPEELQNNVQSTFYNKVIEEGKTFIFENLEDYKGNPLASTLVEHGYRNLLLIPLCYENRVIGILELANPDPGAINGLSLFKINQVKPIFANALNYHVEEFENKVEAVMLEEYTAIHPSIQWRFREAAIHMLDKNGPQEAITFEGLYPFYGSLDIRDSSKKRNQAIYLDLLENLEALASLLKAISEKYSLSIIEELVFQIERKIEKLKKQFSTDEEAALTEFIRQRANPVIQHLGLRYPEFSKKIEAYFHKTNKDSGIFGQHRLAYDKALSQLNRCMSDILDREEKELQKLVPSYFEKYQTDGIDYNIFLGSSIAPEYPFDDLYIDNVRLRQLIWTCKIVQKLRDSNNCLSAPQSDTKSKKNQKVLLEIAPLILAYGSQITLKFRMDEKRLDVDGSYNIRYEIVKKRIDKSIVKGTKERLTQPGHIAIVYTHEKEARAYRQHFEFLRAQNLIKEEWEELDLELMQGVKGLKALRVKVL